MFDLKACIVCFNMNVTLYNMDNGQLRYNYNTVSGLQTRPENGLPPYLCFECCTYVRKSIKFRYRCQRAHIALQDIIRRNKAIDCSVLEGLKFKGYELNSPLSYMDAWKMHYEEVQHLSANIESITMAPLTGLIPITYYTIQDDVNFLDDIKVENDLKETNSDEKASNNAKCKINEKHNDSFPDDSSDCDDGNSDHEPLAAIRVKNKMEGGEKNESLVEEYANIESLNMTEARAAMEICLKFTIGKHSCDVCNKSFISEKRYKEHLRMHEKHISGTFHCELCKTYYKTDNLLNIHMKEKHLYKYICRKCPEVNFDRVSAKKHFMDTHLRKSKKGEILPKPHWIQTKTVKPKVKKKRKKKDPDDYLKSCSLSQEEQYKMVVDRQQSRNYIETEYKCEFCFRGFTYFATLSNHMKKHNPIISGKLQCDMCKMHFKNTLQMSRHMVMTHLHKFSCQLCTYVTYHSHQARMHYKWHKNATYKCPYCEKEFKKPSSRTTHIRRLHPSTNICNLCGHGFISVAGLDGHRKKTHSVEELEQATALTVDRNSPLYCTDCEIQFLNEEALRIHFGSSNKHASTNVSVNSSKNKKKVNRNVRKPIWCGICRKHIICNEKEMREHLRTKHPSAEQKFICDICGHTTKQLVNLQIHRRTHTKERPYGCPHCDKRFNTIGSRNIHLLVHTGEKPYQCPQCERRFTQKYTVKLHVQTVHLKIPYPPWDKRRRQRQADACHALDNVECLL